ncbi:DUF4181 domain-containing protein [Priestia sp. SB1]|uniref:DUF4181 domain-containing protein n=1 Tax=Priestia sp. SB1 TaxID=3132359 RepID=UPI0031791AFC
MIKTIIFIVIMIVIAHFLEKYLRRKMNLETDVEKLKESVSKSHKWVSNSFYIIFIATFIYFDNVPIWVMLAAYCICYQGYKIFMEFKHDKASREYVLSVLFFCFYGVSIVLGTFIGVF